MPRRGSVVVVILIVLGLVLPGAYRATAQEQRKKDPMELVLRTKSASLEELRKLTFLELHFMKNAIFASRGYKFADDRPWLNEFFCGKTGKIARQFDRAVARVCWRPGPPNCGTRRAGT